MTPLDLKRLLTVLNEHRVEFVVVGAVSVAAHGHVRATQDLDIVPEFDANNLARLSQALVELEATMPTAGGRLFELADQRELLRRRNVTLMTAAGGLDIIQRLPGIPPFEGLAARAIVSDLLGEPVRICSLPDLRRMKEARGSTQDRADLEALAEDS